MNGKKDFLEKMRAKLIQHKAKTIQKDILYAYQNGDYAAVESLTGKLMELSNEQMNNMNKKMDQQLAASEKQINQAFAALGMNFSPNQEQIVKEAMTSEPLSKEEDEEVERILQDIMKRSEEEDIERRRIQMMAEIQRETQRGGK